MCYVRRTLIFAFAAVRTSKSLKSQKKLFYDKHYDHYFVFRVSIIINYVLVRASTVGMPGCSGFHKKIK